MSQLNFPNFALSQLMGAKPSGTAFTFGDAGVLISNISNLFGEGGTIPITGNLEVSGYITAATYGRFGTNLTVGSTTQNTSTLTITTQIGTLPTAPSGAMLHSISSTGAANRLVADTFGGVASFTGRRTNGTLSSPLGLTNGNLISALVAMGHDGTNYGTSSKGLISVSASENWSSSANGTNILFYNTLNGTTSQREIARIENSGNVLLGTTTDDGINRLQVNGGIKYQVLSNRKTANYTLLSTDISKIIEMNVASANTLTVPSDSNATIPIGSQIYVTQYGVGTTTLVADMGVTINSVSGALSLASQYAGVTLYKVAANEWYAFGLLTV